MMRMEMMKMKTNLSLRRRAKERSLLQGIKGLIASR